MIRQRVGLLRLLLRIISITRALSSEVIQRVNTHTPTHPHAHTHARTHARTHTFLTNANIIILNFTNKGTKNHITVSKRHLSRSVFNIADGTSKRMQSCKQIHTAAIMQKPLGERLVSSLQNHRVLGWIEEERYNLFTQTRLAHEYRLCCHLLEAQFSFGLEDKSTLLNCCIEREKI